MIYESAHLKSVVKTLEFKGRRNSGGEVAESVKCITMNKSKTEQENPAGVGGRRSPEESSAQCIGLWDVEEIGQ